MAPGHNGSVQPARGVCSHVARHWGVIAAQVVKRPPTQVRAPSQVPASLELEQGCGTGKRSQKPAWAVAQVPLGGMQNERITLLKRVGVQRYSPGQAAAPASEQSMRQVMAVSPGASTQASESAPQLLSKSQGRQCAGLFGTQTPLPSAAGMQTKPGRSSHWLWSSQARPHTEPASRNQATQWREAQSLGEVHAVPASPLPGPPASKPASSAALPPPLPPVAPPPPVLEAPPPVAELPPPLPPASSVEGAEQLINARQSTEARVTPASWSR